MPLDFWQTSTNEPIPQQSAGFIDSRPILLSGTAEHSVVKKLLNRGHNPLKTISFLVSCASALVLQACGSSSTESDSPAAATAAWTDTEMQLIVANNCALSGCHSGTQLPDYRNITETAMKADTIARDQVASGLMPQGGSLSASQKAVVARFFQ